MSKVGMIVAVMHRSVKNTKTEEVKLVPAKQSNERIVAEYLNGAVRTQSGDVWHVRQTNKHKGAQFVTVH